MTTQLMPNATATSEDDMPSPSSLLAWGLVDAAIIAFTLTGNLLTAVAIRTSRRLSSLVSNQFIFSLALSDIMVALFVPYHYAFYVGSALGARKLTCLLRFTLVCLACSCSIYNLLAIAGDRYLAIVHPLHYGRYMTRRAATGIVLFGWTFSFALAAVPLYWNTWEGAEKCETEAVLPGAFVNYVLTPMFAAIWLVMLVVYVKIWREASGHARRLKATAKYCSGAPGLSDSKSVQVVLLIMGCFSVCWLPYFAVLVYNRVAGSVSSGVLYEVTFTLAMANSGMNPLIYAWKNANFRAAFYDLIRCRDPNCHRNAAGGSYVTNHVPSKKSSSAAANGGGDGAGPEVGLEMGTVVGEVEGEHSTGTECTDANSVHRHL